MMETLGKREKQKKENKSVYFPKSVSISSPNSSCEQLWTQTPSGLCDLCQLRLKPNPWWPCPVAAPSPHPQCPQLLKLAPRECPGHQFTLTPPVQGDPLQDGASHWGSLSMDTHWKPDPPVSHWDPPETSDTGSCIHS